MFEVSHQLEYSIDILVRGIRRTNNMVTWRMVKLLLMWGARLKILSLSLEIIWASFILPSHHHIQEKQTYGDPQSSSNSNKAICLINDFLKHLYTDFRWQLLLQKPLAYILTINQIPSHKLFLPRFIIAYCYETWCQQNFLNFCTKVMFLWAFWQKFWEF